MTVATASFPVSLQVLIDARLDSIERMLIGRVPRADRIAIVEEVESQIHELLGDRDPESLTPDDLLDVLRRLDPPEAYLAHQNETKTEPTEFYSVPSVPKSAKSLQGPKLKARIGGIFGICSLGLMLLAPLAYFFALMLDSEVVLLLGLGATWVMGIVCGLVGVILCIQTRRQGAFAIMGLVMAALSLPIWLIACPIGALVFFS